jgi:glycosyltransferase involved in cell wall biosynthesis
VPLKVIGEGRAGDSLRRTAGPEVESLGRLEDEAVAEHLARCRALVLPAKEDFGLTAVEAQAAGRPVVALAAGGALETVIPGETGLLVPEATVTAFASALAELGRRSWSPTRARANAARFGAERFAREIVAEVEAAIAAKRTPAR